jgi:hypothetical protein
VPKFNKSQSKVVAQFEIQQRRSLSPERLFLLKSKLSWHSDPSEPNGERSGGICFSSPPAKTAGSSTPLACAALQSE